MCDIEPSPAPALYVVSAGGEQGVGSTASPLEPTGGSSLSSG